MACARVCTAHCAKAHGHRSCWRSMAVGLARCALGEVQHQTCALAPDRDRGQWPLTIDRPRHRNYRYPQQDHIAAQALAAFRVERLSRAHRASVQLVGGGASGSGPRGLTGAVGAAAVGVDDEREEHLENTASIEARCVGCTGTVLCVVWCLVQHESVVRWPDHLPPSLTAPPPYLSPPCRHHHCHRQPALLGKTRRTTGGCWGLPWCSVTTSSCFT